MARENPLVCPTLIGEGTKKSKIHFNWEKQNSERLNHLPPHRIVSRAAVSWPGLRAHRALTWGAGAVGAFPLTCWCRWQCAGWWRGVSVYFISQWRKTEGWADCFTSSACRVSPPHCHSSTFHSCGCKPYRHPSQCILFYWLTTHKVSVTVCHLVFHFSLLVRMAEKLPFTSISLCCCWNYLLT